MYEHDVESMVKQGFKTKAITADAGKDVAEVFLKLFLLKYGDFVMRAVSVSVVGPLVFVDDRDAAFLCVLVVAVVAFYAVTGE